MTTLEQRIRRLEDLEEIRTLAIRYGLAVDDRDLDTLRQLFTDDAELRTMNGPSKGKGIDAVINYFRTAYTTLGPTNHFTHGHVITFDPTNPDHATGTVTAHAEVVRNGTPMITAMRYHDTYTRTPHGWRFRQRIQSYMYFVDIHEYPDALGHPLRMRRNPNDWQPADWPDTTPPR